MRFTTTLLFSADNGTNMDRTIDNYDLKKFLIWYREHFGKKQTFQAGLSISMAGHFHILPKEAIALLRRCEQLKFITIKRENVTINVEEEEL